MKDTTYYDDESGKYSQKRYPAQASDHSHYLFKKRLQLLTQLLRKVNSSGELLEIGCADGVVLAQLQRDFSGFKLSGVDISSGMIAVAKEHNSSAVIQFALRDDKIVKDETFDVIVEVGVLNLTDLSIDLNFTKRALKMDGYYVCSLSSRTSLLAVFKTDTISAYRHLLSYREYEQALSQHFVILERVPYGLFVPHIWKIPPLARMLQPLFDLICRFIAPDLLHERIYLMQKKPRAS